MIVVLAAGVLAAGGYALAAGVLAAGGYALAAGGYALYRYRANVIADAKAESAKLAKDIQTELDKVLGEVKTKL